MISKRIIPCLDVRNGKLTKGIKFKGNIDIGDPVEAAREYYEQGADEIVFYDITASSDGRDIMIDVVSRVAQTIFIPFSVGGGIRNLEDMRRVIMAGAEKVSVNSTAVTNPEIIAQGAQAFGSQSIVLGMERGEVLSFGFMERWCAVPDDRFAGKRSFRLQQAQLAGTRDSFGATLNL